MIRNKIKSAKAIIPMSSMADIAFLLLIFFIVTTTQERPIVLPDVETTFEIEEDERLSVMLDKQEKVYIDSEIIDRQYIDTYLATEWAEDPSRVVLFYGDRDLSFGEVWNVLGNIKKAGWQQVHLVCEKKNKQNE